MRLTAGSERVSDTRKMGKPSACPTAEDGSACRRHGPHRVHGYIADNQKGTMGIRWLVWYDEDREPREHIEVVGTVLS